ncbi:acetylornithine deacetylase [Anaerolinea thermolimosa]|uniref:dipeptidase n=1 Tax=Anaerolinea thermolimosa TaxID=229919 RepID=UPI000780A988|nr:dipeptidase [Anaerolinea thermolimosa]GAP06483.1 acetylornithine deacetylase [Anaerolinea thermolimosa]
MPDQIDQAIIYARNHHSDFLSELKDFVSIPSVSTTPEYKQEMEKAAHKVAQMASSAGLENIQIYPTSGHPIVFGEWLHAKNQPTILIYGHYDVQPVDPVDLWETPPFQPSLRDQYFLGRGASDMKGQIVAVFAALQSIRHTTGSFPVNIKLMIEGEEEIGSPHLRTFIEDHRSMLSCDVSLNPDAGMIAPDLPTLVYALRGLVFFELKVFGPEHDLHSGVFGGVVHNPAQALCEIIASMHDENGRITIPGFYDHVRTLSLEEREELSRLPMGEDYYLQQTGAPQLWGEPDYTPVERIGARPTLEVNGLFSGFTGQGTKTVLPAYAMAKISCRIVADQEPDEIHRLLRHYLEQHIPSTVRWELNYFGGAPASITDPNHPAATAMKKALELVWKTRPLLKREGGSIPVVGDIQKILGADSVLTGFGLPDDRIHSPNERLHLPTWFKGIEALIAFFYLMKSNLQE